MKINIEEVESKYLQYQRGLISKDDYYKFLIKNEWYGEVSDEQEIGDMRILEAEEIQKEMKGDRDE